MLVVAILAASLAAQQPEALWVNAHELPGRAPDVQAGGEYLFWAWARTGEDAALRVNGEKLPVSSKKGEDSPEYAWDRAGVVQLDAGPVELGIEGPIVAVAFSNAERFDPQRALADMRVFDQPRAVTDRRALSARHTDTVFTMPAFGTVEAWESYAEKLRRRILLACGLWPLPERTPLNARVFDRVEHADYTVEKVHFEAWPGFLVTGNLYRPVGEGPFPGVVCPHGHWEHGRLEDGERGSVPARNITLARMGIVAFTYDMVGYNDSLQFEHGWGGDVEKLWGIHPFAMQLWSSIRAVDFIESLPEVDTERIGCTGASGGGTQTFALTAVDDRVKVAAPVNMISSRMQGGCTCENAPILRLDNSNMEIGALMAPRPLLLVSATGDWTRETPRVEYPAIRSIYALYDAEDKVRNVHIDAGHNYNLASREAMYRFFGRWLLGGDWEGYSEPEYALEERDKLRVFPGDTPPDGYPSSDELIAGVRARIRAKWAALLPADTAEAAAFRENYGAALSQVLGAETVDVNGLAPERLGTEEREGYVAERWILRRPCVGDAVPAVFYRGYGPEKQDAVLLVHEHGKAAFADLANGGPGPLVRGLISRGKAILCIDAFLTGEHHAPDQRTERVREGRYMDTFQPTDAGYRVQDVLTALAFLDSRRDLTGKVAVAGFQDAGLWCLFASAIAGAPATVLADLNGFPLDEDRAWAKRFYSPCILAVGGEQTAVAMLADRELVLMNTAGTGERRWPGARIEANALSLDRLLELLG